MSEATTLDSPKSEHPPPAPTAGKDKDEGSKHEVSLDQKSRNHTTLRTYEESRKAKYLNQFESK